VPSVARVFACGAVVAAMTMAATSCAVPQSLDEDTSITIGSDIWALYGGWDPVNGAVMTLSSQAVYDSLFYVPAAGLPAEPSLAEEFELSEDGKTLDVTLRNDVDFTDGTHLDAASLEEYFDTILASEAFVWPTLAAEFGTRATATGEYTLRFTTTAVINDGWFFLMSLTPVASPTAVATPGAFDDGPVGSGPYVLDDFVTDVSASFVRNPDYWDPEAFPFDEVTLSVYQDPVAGLNALKTGQVDAALLNPSMGRDAEANGFRLSLGTGAVVSLSILDIEGKTQPALADRRVRQAMNMAFDRQAILENLNLGYGSASGQLAGEGFAGYVEGGDDRYPYDVEAAKALLAEAGYEDGFELTIPTTAETAAVLPIIEQSLTEIGIAVTFESIPGDGFEYHEALATGKYPVSISSTQASGGWGGDMYGYFAIDWSSIEPDAPEWFALATKGTPEQSAEAQDRLGVLWLDEALSVPFSSAAGIIASIPEVEVETALDTASVWLRQYRLVD
jgi:peptide/nickel transport system substrate-binding protein